MKAADEVCTKVLAEAIAGGIGTARDELDRARAELQAAVQRVREQEKKVADREAWLARILEGVPMEKINAADKAGEAPGPAKETP